MSLYTLFLHTVLATSRDTPTTRLHSDNIVGQVVVHGLQPQPRRRYLYLSRQLIEITCQNRPKWLLLVALLLRRERGLPTARSIAPWRRGRKFDPVLLLLNRKQRTSRLNFMRSPSLIVTFQAHRKHSLRPRAKKSQRSEGAQANPSV